MGTVIGRLWEKWVSGTFDAEEQAFMADLLLPGTRSFRRATMHVSGKLVLHEDNRANALYTIGVLWHALRILYAAEAEGPYRSWMVWESEELKLIREAIEEESDD